MKPILIAAAAASLIAGPALAAPQHQSFDGRGQVEQRGPQFKPSDKPAPIKVAFRQRGERERFGRFQGHERGRFAGKGERHDRDGRCDHRRGPTHRER